MKKKFTMLLAALLCCVGVAKAQWGNRPIESVSSTAATELVDGYYVIYNNGRGTFLNAEASLGQAKVTWPTSASYTGTEALNSDEDLTNASGTKNKNAYVFYANVEGTTVSLQNGYGNYVPALTSDGNFNYVSDEAFWSFAFKTDANSSYVFLSNSESGKGLDCNGWGADSHTYSTAAGWNADGSQSVSGNQSWTFYPVVFKSDVTLVDLVINYTFGGNQVKTETVQGLAGSEYTIPALDFTSVASCAIDDAAATEGATIVVPDANATVTVELANNFPFEVSADYENATWYVLQIRSNNKKYVVRSESAPYANTTTTPTTNDALWAFVGNPFDGIQVLNKAAGTGKTLALDANNNAVMTEGATTWNITKGNGGFLLRNGNEGNNYLHDLNSTLKIWADNGAAADPGSAFVVTSEAEMISLATTAMGLASKLDTYAEASYYTYPNAAVAEAKATLQDVATPTDFLTALQAKATVESAQKILNDAGKGTTAPAIGDFIVLKNKAKNEYMTTMESGDEVHRTSDKNNPKALWKVVAGGENKVKLYNVASEKYLGELSQSTKVLMVEEANAAQFTFSNVTDVYAAFTSGGGTYTYAHMDGWYDRVVGWEAPASTDASLWLVSNVRPLSVIYKYNGEVLSETTEIVKYGTVYTVTSPYDFTKVSACKKGEEALEATDGVYSFEVTEATTLIIELEDDVPFVKTTLNQDGSFPENTTWYVVKQHSSQGYAWTWKYDETNGVTAEPGLTTGYTDNHLWCFAGSKDDIKIYNKVAGKGYSLTNTDPASMAAENAAVWKMVKSEAEATFAGKNPFCLQKGNENLYLNAQTENGINKLKYWTSRDQGSTIMVIAQSAIELEALVNRLNGTIDAMIDNAGNGIGYYESADDVAKLKGAIEKAQALLESNSKKNEDYVAAIAELKELEIKAAKIELPKAGKYYRIGYDFGSDVVKYMESESSSVKGLNMTSEAEGLSTVFYYADDKLQSVTTKKYLKEDGGARGLYDGADNAGKITFSAGNTLGKIKIQAPSYLHANVNNGNYFVDHCGSDGEHAQHNFVIEEVTIEELNGIYLNGCAYITALDYTENSNYPVIVNNARSNWAVADKPVALNTLAKLGLTKDVSDTKQQFAIITPDGGKNYYLYSVHAKRYLKSNNTFGAQGEPILFNDASSRGENKVQVRFKGVEKYINVGGSNQMVIDDWGTIDVGNACEMVQCNTLTFNLDEALEIFNNGADITLTYKLGDKLVSTTTYETQGETFSFNNPYAFTIVTSCKKDGEDLEATEGTYSFEITGDAHIVVELQENLPFRYADSYDKIEHWYFMKIRDDGFTYMGYDAEKTYIRANQSTVPAESKDAYTWGFVGNPFDGFSIVNYVTGKTKVLSAPVAPNTEKNADQLARMVEVTKEYTGNLVWNIKAPTHDGSKPGVFYIEHPTAKSYAFNRQGYEGANAVCYWTGRDTGSAIQVEERGVFNLSDLKTDRVYALQAERSPLMYSATEGMTTKLSSGMVDGVGADASETNQQFLIIRSKTEGEYYLYSVGAKMFVDANLDFTYYPEPVLSFEAYNGTNSLSYPWWVKINDKYVIPGAAGTAGNTIFHVEGGDDDEGKRYRIVNAGAYDASAVLAVINKVEHLVKSTADLSNNKVYTVTPKDNATTGVWDVKYDGENATMLAITRFTGNAVDPTSLNQQFAFLTVNGEHYLYSYGAKKFVAKNEGGQILTDELSDACRVEFLNSTIASEQKLFPLVVKVGGNQLHSSYQGHLSDKGGVITTWDHTESGGNAVAIVAVDGTIDLSEAIAKIEEYQVTVLRPKLEALIGEAQALLDKNYLDTEDVDKLTSAKKAAENVYDNPTAESLAKQVGLLAEAIAAATYVREVEDFKNAYVYTFVTLRGWVGADENSENLIGTVNSKVDPAPTPSDDNSMFQWAVYKSVNEHYYLYNIGKQKFMGMPNGETIPFADAPQGQDLTFKRHDDADDKWADYPIMFSPDNKGAVSQNGNAGLFYWAGGWNTTDDDGSNHKVTIVGKIADETLTTIAKAVKLYEDAKERTEAIQALEAAITAAQAKVDATGAALGYYSSNKLDAATELKAIVAFKEGITEDTTVPEIEEQTAAAEAITASFSVNLPEAGKFYRIKNNGGTGYLSTGTGTGRTQFVEGIGESANSVFYYTGTKLLDYTTGLYLATGNGSMLSYTETVGEAAGTTIAFSASPVVGKLLISFNDGNRSFYSNGAGDSDAASKGQTGEHYRFTVEEVTTLPVTVASIGYATLFAPVALQIPDGVKNVYVGKIDEDCLILTPINGNVIPANTGVLIEADDPNTYTFPIVENVKPIEPNAFTGSYAKSVKNPDKKVYTLQNGKNGVGFYLFKGYKDENNKEGTKTYINGFRSWVELPLSASAQGLRIRKEGTNVEDVELENELFPVIYDLMGRRVEKIEKGLYIVNGKKILVK